MPTESPSGTFINDTTLLIVPDGMDPSILIWNLKASQVKYEFPDDPAEAEKEFEKIADRSSKAEEISEALHSYLDRNNEGSLPGTYEPDWYGGTYIMIDQEYGLDNPYETDGTDEPFKYCIQIVRGMESKVDDEVKQLLKPYEDYIIYKTVDYSFRQLRSLLDDTIIPEFSEHGIKCAASAASSRYNYVTCGFMNKYFNEKTFAFAKELANKYNVVITVELWELQLE